MGIEEAHRRLAAGWQVEPPLLELIEGDYDSAQRKRFIRAAQNEGLYSMQHAQSDQR